MYIDLQKYAKKTTWRNFNS